MDYTAAPGDRVDQIGAARPQILGRGPGYHRGRGQRPGPDGPSDGLDVDYNQYMKDGQDDTDRQEIQDLTEDERIAM
jgi:hypothetical protein